MPQPACAIVGAGEGLGRSLAAKSASQGFDIALISRSEDHCKAAIDTVGATNNNVEGKLYSADATLPETVESALAKVTRELGEIEVLIYNVRNVRVCCH
ncbi:MAG: short-subunit dehydrogenase [Planctomycetota bacterium]|jgi:short-subunit dehydrogenase